MSACQQQPNLYNQGCHPDCKDDEVSLPKEGVNFEDVPWGAVQETGKGSDEFIGSTKCSGLFWSAQL